ncbi:16401_t:CDS:2, partial [Racocetra fulgida]
MTLHDLEKRGLTQAFFSIWFENIEKFKRVHDKKLVIVALCSLLELPFEQLPPTLQGGWTQVLDGILTSLDKAYGEDDSVGNEVLFESPLDKVDVYIKFHESFI